MYVFDCRDNMVPEPVESSHQIQLKFSSLVYWTSFKHRMTDQVAHRNGSAKLCSQFLQPNVLVLWPAPDLLRPQRLRSGKIEVW